MAERISKKGLGMGLEALFGSDDPATVSDGTQMLPLRRVEPRPGQPRTDFDEASLTELAESIARYGVLQPVTVRPIGDGYYQIVAGERRWRAARMAGLNELPVRIIEADDRRTAELALVENLQREDLNPIEEARGYRTLMEDYGLTQEETARSVGKSRPAIANALRLLALDEEVLQLVERGLLTAGHGRALLGCPEGETQRELANRVVAQGLSVRQTEQLAARAARQKPETPTVEGPMVDYCRTAADRLGQTMGRRVKITEGRRSGRIELEYYGADDREALLQALAGLGKLKKR